MCFSRWWILYLGEGKMGEVIRPGRQPIFFGFPSGAFFGRGQQKPLSNGFQFDLWIWIPAHSCFFSSGATCRNFEKKTRLDECFKTKEKKDEERFLQWICKWFKDFSSATSFQNLSTHVLSMFQTKTWTTHCQPSEAQNGQKLKGTSWPLVFDLFGRSRVSESSICNERKIQQKSHRNILGFTFWKSSQPQQKTLDLQQKSHFDLFKMRVF